MSGHDARLDLSGLPESLRERVATHWETYIDNAGELPPAGALRDSLARVWACSEYLARSFALHPRRLQELVASGELERAYAPGELRGRVAALADDLDGEEDLYRALRRLRQREALRIAWRDLAGWAPLDEVMATLSELADGCVTLALDTLYQSACAARGTPRDADGDAVRLSVLGLGKLGGHELNFSSDIDLILAYRADGETDAARPLSNHEFFSKLARRLIHALDHITEDGRVFRVDMRLRPNGRSGPLALSFDAMIQYYQVHGRDWERYALVKARPLNDDDGAGQWLLEQLRPFVYRKYLDFGAIQAIRDMKAIIDREVRRKHGEGDIKLGRGGIKLGRGGIREIEFIVQSLQLIRGGREPRLQTSRLYTALHELSQTDALADDTVAVLGDSYPWLRRLEHRLQMLADAQTHVLPKEPLARARVALAMDAADWPALEQAVRDVKDRVHARFQHLLSERPPPGDALSTLVDVWSGAIERDRALPLLAEAGYAQPAETLDLLRQFRQGKSYHAHSHLGRERLDRLAPAMIQLAGRATQPQQTLTRLLQFVEAVGRRSAYLILLIENPQALEQLVRLCSASAWVSGWISKYPLLLEELLSPIASTPESFERVLDEEIEHRLAPLDALDIETHMEAFRELHHAQVLRIAAADIGNAIDREQVARRLCRVAEKLLERVAVFCGRELATSIGTPSAAHDDADAAFGIIGYGKLGSLELGYNSDIDLVYLYQGYDPAAATRGGRRSVSNEQYFARLAQRITHVITTRTPAGVMYEIDTRLRPSGGAGPLVTSLPAFRAYQAERAWTWEHQALVRARMVCGPQALVTGFEAARRAVICAERDPDKLRDDVARMRSRMRTANDRSRAGRHDLKQCPGGIIDIEFIVQYYVLWHAHRHAALAEPRNTLELLAAIDGLSLMAADDAALLDGAYRQYLGADHRRKLAEQELALDDHEFGDERVAVAAIWKRLFT